MATTNNITGDLLVSKSSEAYRDNYDKIFRKKSQDCTHSHPHENMSEDCEKLTVVARENYYKALDGYKEKQ